MKKYVIAVHRNSPGITRLRFIFFYDIRNKSSYLYSKFFFHKDNLTVTALSNIVYITPQYLSRLFRRFLGCSVYEYITTYRINKAKEFLLVHQHMEVQEIAARTGFPDSSHFIAMFRKMTGVTPLEFRKIN